MIYDVIKAKKKLIVQLITHILLGVVQVVNKTNGVCFTAADEHLFKTFSVYCALALHYTRLHNKMMKTVMADLILKRIFVRHT